MAGRVVRAEELNAVLESLQPKLAAADQEELRGVGGDETVSERHVFFPPSVSDQSPRCSPGHPSAMPIPLFRSAVP